MRRAGPDADEPRLFDLPLDHRPTPGEAPVEDEWTSEEEPAAAKLFPDLAEQPDSEPASVPKATPAPATTAPLGARLEGGLADIAVLLAVAVGMWVGLGWMGVEVGLAAWPAAAIFLVAFSFLYHVLPLAFWGRTPGMALVGLVARSTDGRPLTFGQTALRWLGALITVAVAGLPLLLALTGASLSDRLSGSRTWHDSIAGVV